MGDMLQAIIDFWIDVVLFVPRLIFWAALEILELALLALPDLNIPDPASLSGSFTGDLVWFLTLFEVPAGLGFVVSALVARFILRRVPLIG
jgi:hypothetical protein